MRDFKLSKSFFILNSRLHPDPESHYSYELDRDRISHHIRRRSGWITDHRIHPGQNPSRPPPNVDERSDHNPIHMSNVILGLDAVCCLKWRNGWILTTFHEGAAIAIVFSLSPYNCTQHILIYFSLYSASLLIPIAYFTVVMFLRKCDKLVLYQSWGTLFSQL